MTFKSGQPLQVNRSEQLGLIRLRLVGRLMIRRNEKTIGQIWFTATVQQEHNVKQKRKKERKKERKWPASASASANVFLATDPQYRVHTLLTQKPELNLHFIFNLSARDWQLSNLLSKYHRKENLNCGRIFQFFIQILFNESSRDTEYQVDNENIRQIVFFLFCPKSVCCSMICW